MDINIHVAPQPHITPDLHLLLPKKKLMVSFIDWSMNKGKGMPLLNSTTTSRHTLQLLWTQRHGRKILVQVRNSLPYWTRDITRASRRLVPKGFCPSRVENAGDENKPCRWPAKKSRELREMRLWRRDRQTPIRCIHRCERLVAPALPHRRVAGPIFLCPTIFKTCSKKLKLLRPTCRRQVEAEVESSHRE